MPTKRSQRKSASVSSKAIANDFFEQLRDKGIEATPTQIKKITEHISETLAYQPKVGVFGKTGAGKSELCNALFGHDVAKVSDIAACTRRPQEILVKLTAEGQGIALLDVPGVGESRDRDTEYAQLYKSLLPNLDVVLWVLKGDDRAFSTDEHFYTEVVQPTLTASKIPIIFVINQVDKIEPFREWDLEQRKPSPKQAKNIKAKIATVHSTFSVASARICAVSAKESYGLVQLVEKIVRCLPKEKKYGLAREALEEVVSPRAMDEAKKGVWDTVKSYAGKLFKEALPHIAEALIKIVLRRIF